ncbi:hypothetical protein PLCT2_02531 [Planctomycetaceae bacterium]|nr:hypothetical protein PLCT2_02531 [Planctomycetaceae bacterium]
MDLLLFGMLFLIGFGIALWLEMVIIKRTQPLRYESYRKIGWGQDAPIILLIPLLVGGGCSIFWNTYGSMIFHALCS